MEQTPSLALATWFVVDVNHSVPAGPFKSYTLAGLYADINGGDVVGEHQVAPELRAADPVDDAVAASLEPYRKFELDLGRSIARSLRSPRR